MKITYNSPVILTFATISVVVYLVTRFLPGLLGLFTVPPDFSPSSISFWFRSLSYVFGHANMPHLFGNLSLILLIGPIVEEKYGAGQLLLMMFITAFLTAMMHVFFFNKGLLGASGIVFMLVILSSLTNFRRNELPLTFVMIAILFIGKEIFAAFSPDNISQFSHIIGGLFGSVFGIKFAKRR